MPIPEREKEEIKSLPTNCQPLLEQEPTTKSQRGNKCKASKISSIDESEDSTKISKIVVKREERNFCVPVSQTLSTKDLIEKPSSLAPMQQKQTLNASTNEKIPNGICVPIQVEAKYFPQTEGGSSENATLELVKFKNSHTLETKFSISSYY